MSIEENKAIAHRVPLEAFNQGKLEAIDETIADDVVDHSNPVPGMPTGKAGVKALVGALRSAFPDFKITIDFDIAEGDLVASYGTTTGTMKGDFAGMPASGKTAKWSAMHVVRIKDGKIVEHWQVQDQMSMLQQLGFMPEPAGAAAG
jgi:steroid delta-isomerase-like uncharacterized protein